MHTGRLHTNAAFQTYCCGEEKRVAGGEVASRRSIHPYVAHTLLGLLPQICYQGLEKALGRGDWSNGQLDLEYPVSVLLYEENILIFQASVVYVLGHKQQKEP